MWDLDYKESWARRNWCFWTVVLEKTLESPLDSKEIQPVHPKSNQSWTFIGRTDAEAETPIFWPPVAKNWLIWKDPDTRKDWRQEELGTTEDEMIDNITESMDMSLSKLQELVIDREEWCAVVHGVTKSPTWLSDWTDAILFFYSIGLYFHLQIHHNLVLLLLWLSSFFLEFWAPADLGSSSFIVISFCLFILFTEFSWKECWSGLPFTSTFYHIFSELSIITCLSWVALHSMAHSFIELDKAVVHVISFIRFLWL